MKFLGADALLDITIEEWGTSYLVINSTTTVKLNYRLVDLHSGQEIWNYTRSASTSGNSSGNGWVGVLAGSLAHAIQSSSGDEEVGISTRLNGAVIPNNGVGLLSGPRAKEPGK